MNLLSRLWSRLSSADGVRVQAPTPGGPCRDDEPPCMGCGWFDSSHELQTGLLVSEHDNDALAAQALPLAIWLDVQLADWQPDSRMEAH